ncbi:flagellar assembly peptidoglycan hydrolase FlgJ [Bordetella avium]|uniref:flagellar assembly peptidoglycan hydrolase FlgJ n=1 Tax=Bordetella avium TaxID=521 RepID=UPI000E0AA095|nr:flagellar assembly peptidoglycan hydrolase FlgJ [Bordetella avium]RIQ11530.1 flagellar assembly peptidoglycan hydrolase FlgJ [Bordetella avium]RIQ34923.1 flagellar assembly peptidoglycan hydrolase FlgJ [Bordetella avium]RIQ38253.1 flagellar assembly peptidoglycan hydrolase FlgJ [Bordetella avium]RIQ39259.1 flagellar assembly peptidoglycan hydrolase FlgJ [Bordetella avium]RIQ44907.1 flagellar assembly peptidoglycan hydrolase FlgJ [Bordetella avium]
MALTSNLAGAQPQDSVFDLGRLGNLKRSVGQNPADAAQQKEVAQQFEALFLQMMLKRMREATPKDGLFDSQQTEMLQSMSDEQMALQLAKPGVGLADALLKQMQQQNPTPAQAGDEATANTVAGKPPRLMRDQYGRYAQQPEGGVAALLNVLRNNRPVDRAFAAAEGAPDHVVDFVSRMSRAANAVAAESGVPARLILGQAALESGWGKREIRQPDGSTSYNLFGIKAGAGWKGRVVHVLTTEYVDGVPQKVSQPFRAYNSYEESFADYARLVGGSARYETVAQASNETEAAHRIQRSGYATDPRYAEKLIKIMSQLRASVAQADFSGSP